MSEVQSRPSNPRGRGSSRGGGRGGYSSRGGRGGSRQINGTKPEVAAEIPTYDDEGEIGQLKKMYASKLSTVKEMFPDWTDEDIVYALQETDGDLESTIERISEGIYNYHSPSSSYPRRLIILDRQHLSIQRGQEEGERSISIEGQGASGHCS